MSFGFAITTGEGALVQTISSDNPPGVIVDSFYVSYGTTVTRSYPNFPGSALYVIAVPQDATKMPGPVISVDNSGKSVSVQSPTAASAFMQVGFIALVLGV